MTAPEDKPTASTVWDLIMHALALVCMLGVYGMVLAGHMPGWLGLPGGLAIFVVVAVYRRRTS
jgi:hypothetical protein